jgi:hypothetical protein
MIELRMARLTPIQPDTRLTAPRADETELAFRYLYTFRRIVVGLALAGAGVAFVEQYTSLCAAFACIGVGELIESSYYLNVLRWRQHRQAALSPRHADEGASPGPRTV